MGAVISLLQKILAGSLLLSEKAVLRLQGADKARQDNKFLYGNFAPVERDLFTVNVPIEGTLPPEVSGLFARNGPNPKYITGNIHWFDGDGYIHSVLMDAKTQTANYSGQFVRTSKLKQEEAVGHALTSKLGDMEGPLSLAHMAIEKGRSAIGVLNTTEGIYVANTALLWHGGNLFALHEGDQPHLLEVTTEGKIETIGRVHKAGPPGAWFTAHPKIDPGSNHLYAFGYNLQKQPHITFYQMDDTGREIGQVPVNFSKPCMTHDFTMTKNHAIFFETSLYLSPEKLFRSSRSSQFYFDEAKPTRIAMIPLNAKSSEEVQWFDDLPPSFLFHFANAWEETEAFGQKVVKILALTYKHFELSFEGTIGKRGNLGNFTQEELDERSTHLYEYTLNPQTGHVLDHQRLVSHDRDARAWEFPQINPKFVGRTARYVYISVYGPSGESPSFVKVDLKDRDAQGEVAYREVTYGEETYGGEVIFVPKAAGKQNGRHKQAVREDDGYLLTFTYSCLTDSSEMRIYDAKALSLVASIKLPRRVPYGFHAVFVPQAELAKQICHSR